MGYSFAFARPGAEGSFSMNSSEMSMMIEIMREAGALREQGLAPNWTLLPEGVPQAKFRSNSGQLVTPEECRLIAQKLRAALAEGRVSATLSFFDDAPPRKEGEAWVAAWADFNERAAEAEGYTVS